MTFGSWWSATGDAGSFLPSTVPGGSGVNLGGPKYAEYEIERGELLLSGTASLD